LRCALRRPSPRRRRIGNLACQQRQLDVSGETIDTSHQDRARGPGAHGAAWDVQLALIDLLARA
jgi:hypothetical protein